MLFIKPSEISSKIMTLIDESDEYLILVSPYVRISKWYKLLKKLENFKQRNIPLKFLVRDDDYNKESYHELNNIGIPFTTIKDLHCKLYLNEKYAIVSSMNLLLSSEINSIEIAYQTENEAELNELKDFCTRYLNVNFSEMIPSSAKIIGNWKDYVCQKIKESNKSFTKINDDEGAISLNTNSNKYTVFISYQKVYLLRMSAILTNREFTFLSNNKFRMPKVEGLVIELQKGGNNYYDTIWATAEVSNLSQNIHSIHDTDKSFITNKMIEFVLAIDNFKIFYNTNISRF